MYGNGWLGSTASGVSTGKMRLLVDLRRAACARSSSRSRPADDRRRPRRPAPAPARRGTPPPAGRRARWPRSPIAASCWVGVRPSGVGSSMPAATWSFSAATRTWKNSSRLVRADGAELGPLEQRDAGLGGQLEDPVVERQPAQLTVDEAFEEVSRRPSPIARIAGVAALRRDRATVVGDARPVTRRRGGRGPIRARCASRSASRTMRSRLRRNCGSSRGSSTRRARTRARNSSSTCGRPSRRRPPSAATPARGTRCGRGPAAAPGRASDVAVMAAEPTGEPKTGDAGRLMVSLIADARWPRLV